MERHRIGIIIPAFNEAATISTVVQKASPYGIPIVVDDGSDDETAELAMVAEAHVVCHDNNRGYDQALNSGFKKADELNCECVVTMDADGQHDPAIIKKFIRTIEAGADLVVGIRNRRQRLGEHIFAWAGSLAWGIRDPLCGMKAYRMTLYRELGHFDSYNSIGTELAIFTAKNGKKCIQLDIKTSERRGVSRFGQNISANMRILRALWLGLMPRMRQIKQLPYA